MHCVLPSCLHCPLPRCYDAIPLAPPPPSTPSPALPLRPSFFFFSPSQVLFAAKLGSSSQRTSALFIVSLRLWGVGRIVYLVQTTSLSGDTRARDCTSWTEIDERVAKNFVIRRKQTNKQNCEYNGLDPEGGGIMTLITPPPPPPHSPLQLLSGSLSSQLPL